MLNQNVFSSRPHHELLVVYVHDRLSCVPSSHLQSMLDPRRAKKKQRIEFDFVVFISFDNGEYYFVSHSWILVNWFAWIFLSFVDRCKEAKARERLIRPQHLFFFFLLLLVHKYQPTFGLQTAPARERKRRNIYRRKKDPTIYIPKISLRDMLIEQKKKKRRKIAEKYKAALLTYPCKRKAYMDMSTSSGKARYCSLLSRAYFCTSVGICGYIHMDIYANEEKKNVVFHF